MNKLKNIIIRTYLVIKWGLLILLIASYWLSDQGLENKMIAMIMLPVIYLIIAFIFETIISYIIEG